MEAGVGDGLSGYVLELEHLENEVDDDGDSQSESLVEEVVRDVD